ncbi:hypothetical protein K435DRAFT_848745 [Dendrothele bispora CBS 962.96]|uniref:Vesicle tethering protein Uso1/P115-like head domain-containing protein n=1 Tax=Dendrothele bispora (strain CBS 962.96) TaxID=1314807 RepID=A0A4S8MTY1_DENBC|nr:hypothetical protein K435DRAFT_848745 [Dendrothele bispora CBS 962.96]
MEFFSQTYVALRGPTGAPQTATDTISRLSDRLSPATLLADRRAAVLALKGLARDCKKDVGDRSLSGLLQVLQNDAEVDADIGKAVLETLNLLCEVDPEGKEGKEGRELAMKHTDAVLANEGVVHTMFGLMGDNNFYTRFGTLQLLSTLLKNRRHVVQSYFLTAQAGAASVIATLEDKREIIRNEALSTLQLLVTQSADIQKVLAFEGAFEKLFNIVTQEGGIEGGLVVQDTLACVDMLLRFNSSNQNYFHSTPLPPTLSTLLLFPPNLPLSESAPQQFALQFWDAQKEANVGYIVDIIGLLVGGKAGGGDLESIVFPRLLIELALSSNAPTSLKTRALKLLPTNFSPPSPSPTSSSLGTSSSSIGFSLPSLILTPYIPVPETNGEEWDRLESASALDVLVELGLSGEYGGILNHFSRAGPDADKAWQGDSIKDLELRAAAIGVFENFVRKEQIRTAILGAMLSSKDDSGTGESTRPPTTPLVHSLIVPPPAPGTTPIDPTSVASTQFACWLFACLLRGSPEAKRLAREVKPSMNSGVPQTPGPTGGFFVPADGPPPPGGQGASEKEDDDDDDDPQTLLAILTENLSLAFLSRSRVLSATQGQEHAHAPHGKESQVETETDREQKIWDRLIVSYMSLLATWLWEDPGATKEFLECGGLGVLVEPINQISSPSASQSDTLIPGLCVFLLGITYEFNREPGEITRKTIYPILTRLGVDTLIGRLNRMRDDERIRGVNPEGVVLELSGGKDGKGEVWFDWAFVDFWKSGYYTVQRALSTDPDQLASASGQNAETAILISSLRDSLRSQTEEIEGLKEQLRLMHAQVQPQGSQGQGKNNEEIRSLQSQLSHLHTTTSSEISSLQSQLQSTQSALQASESKASSLESQLAESQQRIGSLQSQISQAQSQAQSSHELTELRNQLRKSEDKRKELEKELESSEEKKKEVEKEQEDLLVLLDEVTGKRKRDKQRMREKGMEVSEDEDEGGDDDDDE